MIPDDQYNMFLTIWGHLGPNLAYKKILGKFTKVLGFGKTPPPCWEKFPNNIVFLVEHVPELSRPVWSCFHFLHVPELASFVANSYAAKVIVIVKISFWC